MTLGDGIEVRVFFADGTVFPILSAVMGFQDEPIGAYRPPMVRVPEPHIEKRRFFFWRKELSCPSFSLICAGNNDGIMPDCPYVFSVHGCHCCEKGSGLVFIDAHGDINTPETTLSGMLGGMPVAVSAGMCLRNLRLESGLDIALPTRYIVMGAVRDTDPLEQELIDRTQIEHITVDDIRNRSENIHAQMERLSEMVDKIYIHVDMDVLDPEEVAGHPLTVPNGPTSTELAGAIREMFRYEKASALGIASTPWGERDQGGLSRQAAYNLIRGAIQGVKER